MPRQTEVIIDSMRVSLTSQNRMLMLKEKNGDLYLPLFIGQFEAESIIIALQEIEVSRPQPHDLIRNIIKDLDARLVSAVITDMKTSTFYAELILTDAEGKEIHVDSRPSDAIAVALRAHVPIYVDYDLLMANAVFPEKDVRGSRPAHFEDDEPDDDDLSAFRDFFNNIG